MAIVVTVPITATTTAISATAETTSRVRSDQRRRADTCYSPGLIRYPAPRRVWIIGVRPASILRRRYEM